jgi:hypothetical protein
VKRKLLLQNLSISAPRMIVRSERPVPLKIAMWITPLIVCGGLILLAYQIGRHFPGNSPDIHTTATKSADELNIDRAAQNQLDEQLKTLETENARLKEDLAYFNTLLPATGSSGITIQKLTVEPVAPNQLRYRALVMQGGSGKQRFSGNLQLAVMAQQGNQTTNLVFPNDQSPEQDKFKIGFKYYQRLDGMVTLPDGAIVKNVQARILENGQVRAQKAIEASSKLDCNG